MSRLKIVIIEDEFFAANHLKKEILKLGHFVVASFHSGKAFLNQEMLDFDLAIVDIQLDDETTGLDVAQELKKRKKSFIFLTANKEQTVLVEAAKLKPQAYISKPFKINDIAATLEIVALSLPQLIQIRTNKGIEHIDPDDVLFIKADDSYTEIKLKESTIIQRKLLKDWLDDLPSHFIRVHRSYVVNGNKIKAHTSTHILVEGHKIPTSRGLKIDFDDLRTD